MRFPWRMTGPVGATAICRTVTSGFKPTTACKYYFVLTSIREKACQYSGLLEIDKYLTERKRLLNDWLRYIV